VIIILDGLKNMEKLIRLRKRATYRVFAAFSRPRERSDFHFNIRFAKLGLALLS
jgi:hypothetical protein